MKTTIPTNELPAEVPEFLKREPNAKGVTLSAGVITPTVKAEGKKTEPKAERVAGSKSKARKAAAPKADKPKVKRAQATGETGTVIDPATGEATVKVSRSIVPLKFKAKYASANGTCGDDMALELKAATTRLNADKREELDVDALWAIAAQNKLDVSKYVNLNNGQKRMNVGNKLRGLLKAGHDVVIGTGKSKRVFKAEDYPV